jgi:hypothetical protein
MTGCISIVLQGHQALIVVPFRGTSTTHHFFIPLNGLGWSQLSRSDNITLTLLNYVTASLLSW